MGDRYMTTQEAADYMRVSVFTVRKWVREKGLPAIKPTHNRTLFDRAELDQWLADRTKETSNG